MCDNEESVRKRQRSLIFGACMLVVLFCLVLAIAARIKAPDVAAFNTADVSTDLPEQVGKWRGDCLYYCQTEQCMRSFPGSELNGSLICPVCKGKMDQVSLAERNILPPDTLITRRLYQDGERSSITVTIVLSGSEQTSIHRPQYCLPAQGFAIEQGSVLTVPLEGRTPLQVTVIQALRGASLPPKRMLLAYWFAGGGHETCGYYRRLVYAAWDNLIYGVRSRWAYVSLQIPDTAGEHGSEKVLEDFVRQLYPLLKPGIHVPQ